MRPCSPGIFFKLVMLAASSLATVSSIALAQDVARQERDRVEQKKQAFLARLPMTSLCSAETAGGVLVPPGEKQWKAGAFEVESLDHFAVTISQAHQLSNGDRATCINQAAHLVPEPVERDRQIENGSLVCMLRTYQDMNRLPQMTACQVRSLLTQPTHLRCRNHDPILDPEGLFFAPNIQAVVSLPQAVVTQGRCLVVQTSPTLNVPMRPE